MSTKTNETTEANTAETTAKTTVTFTDIDFTTEIKDNVATITSKPDYYLTKAKEAGLTEESIKAVNEFDESFLNGVSAVTATRGTDIIKGNKDIKTVLSTTQCGLNAKDLLTTKLDKERSYPIPGTNKTVKKSKFHISVQTSRTTMPKRMVKEIEATITASLLND